MLLYYSFEASLISLPEFTLSNHEGLGTRISPSHPLYKRGSGDFIPLSEIPHCPLCQRGRKARMVTLDSRFLGNDKEVFLRLFWKLPEVIYC